MREQNRNQNKKYEKRLERKSKAGCIFCGQDPYEYVDVGIGFVPVAVVCCERGIYFYQHGWSLHKIHVMEREQIKLSRAWRKNNSVQTVENEEDDIPW